MQPAISSTLAAAIFLSVTSGCSVYDKSLYLAANEQDSEDTGSVSDGATSAGSQSGTSASTSSANGGTSVSTSGSGDDGSSGAADDTGETGGPPDDFLLEILNPEQLRVFPPTGATQSITVRSTNLALAPASGDNEPGVGHIEVRIDGELVDTLTEGDGSSIATTVPIDFPTAGGIHRIEAIALQNDGTPYEGVVGHAPFWVDDGREYIAWVRPEPNTVVAIGVENLEMELASLNFTLVAAAAADDPFAFGEGHVHVLLDRGLPGCLPDCAFVWEQMVQPPGDDRIHRISFFSENPLTPTTLGVHHLEALANDNSHEVYFREAAPAEPVFDAIPLVFVAP